MRKMMMGAWSCLCVFLMLSTAGASESGIVGGKVSKPHSRPYMASLQFLGQHSCGGILIQDDYVLTAAHCKDPHHPMTVVLGAHDISKKEKTQQHFRVQKYSQHPSYTGGLTNDIMLLKLETKAKLNKYVQPIGLARKNGAIRANVKCAVAGWGRTAVDEPPSNVLKEATEVTQFLAECSGVWKEHFHSEQMICTKFSRKSGGVCEGDSGGPLICNTKPLGLTAFTKQNDCSNPKFPHVFTKINFYLPWIKEVMKEKGDAE